MNAKERLCTVIGGCVGAMLTMVVCSFFPLGVQSQGEDVFGEVTCSGLKVVGPDGKVQIRLGLDITESFDGHIPPVNIGINKQGGGAVSVLRKGAGLAVMGISRNGPSMQMLSADKGLISMRFTDQGGKLLVGGNPSKSGTVVLEATETNAVLRVTNKDESYGVALDSETLMFMESLQPAIIMTSTSASAAPSTTGPMRGLKFILPNGSDASCFMVGDSTGGTIGARDGFGNMHTLPNLTSLFK